MRPFKSIKEVYPELVLVADYLPDDEYVKIPSGKMGGRFMLHCTQGSTLKYLIQIWDGDAQGPIATMFAVEKDGTLYQYFDEDYWAYASGCGAKYDAATIHVEMSNKAYVKNWNGRYFWFAGGSWTPYEGTPYKSLAPFQGHTLWDPYPDAQVDTTAKLAAYCLYNHGIPLEFEPRIYFNGPSLQQKGILGHSFVSQVRCDPGPAFPFIKFEDLTRKYFLGLCEKHGYPVYAKKPPK